MNQTNSKFKFKFKKQPPGADIVLGMLPFVREMLRLGCEVVLVANSLPAINDVTAAELRRCVVCVTCVKFCVCLCDLLSAPSSCTLSRFLLPATLEQINLHNTNFQQTSLLPTFTPNLPTPPQKTKQPAGDSG
jgi:hypothetical protein